MMRLLIRADMNEWIATGHVMRCLAIGKEAVKAGFQVAFVGADDQGRIVVEKQGFSYFSLSGVWNDMEQELDKLKQLIREYKADYILVDSYYVTEVYLQSLCRECKVAYLDDINAFLYPCHTLICYANYYKKFRYEDRYPKYMKLLLGCAYAPLREVFSQTKSKEIRREVKEILVLSGGTDPYHFLKSFLGVVTKKKNLLKDVHITAVCGMYNVDYEEVRTIYAEGRNVTVLHAVDNIENYMQNADIAVSAGGTTLYELCACGTPTICYTLADNQLDNVDSFSKESIMVYGGDLRESETVNRIFLAMIDLIKNEKERKKMSTKMQQLVDGKGAERIVYELMGQVEKIQERNEI